MMFFCIPKKPFLSLVSDLASSTEGMNDRVDMTHFWQQIESCIVKRGIDKGKDNTHTLN